MTPQSLPVRRLLPYVGLAFALALVVTGAVMAETHVPVPIAPDAAPSAAGAQVATFALG